MAALVEARRQIIDLRRKMFCEISNNVGHREEALHFPLGIDEGNVPESFFVHHVHDADQEGVLGKRDGIGSHEAFNRCRGVNGLTHHAV